MDANRAIWALDLRFDLGKRTARIGANPECFVSGSQRADSRQVLIEPVVNRAKIKMVIGAAVRIPRFPAGCRAL